MKNEDIAQINFMNWVSYNLPDVFEDTHHFANQRTCSIQEGRKLKRMGVKRGVPDIFVAIPKNGKSGLWIELKEGTGVLSKEQKAFLLRKSERGYVCRVAWGYAAAIDILIDYLELSNTYCTPVVPKTLYNN
jgi:hypothetical protein